MNTAPATQAFCVATCGNKLAAGTAIDPSCACRFCLYKTPFIMDNII